MSWRIKANLRQLLAAERPWPVLGGGGERRFVLAFANTYHLAMSNLGFQTVYALLKNRPQVDVRRAFLPDTEMLAEHVRTATSWLTLEDQRPAAQAEVIAFSLPFENDYLNLLTLLDLAGLPLRAGQREEAHPLILAGGIAPSLNPEPLAPFVDVILIGEAEAVLPEFLDAYQEAASLDRREMLKAIGRNVAGAYLPRFYRPQYDSQGRFQGYDRTESDLPARIERRFLKTIDRPAASAIVSPATEFPDRPLIEIARGCGRGCRFCAAGYILRPPRQPPFEATLEAVRQGAEKFGQVGLVSAAVSDRPGVEELCLAAIHAGAKVSVSSLRADTLSPTLARLLAQAGVRTLTLAPEAGSQRLRQVINKGLSEESILEASLVTLEAGIRNLKLYFMIGLPTETDQDVEAIGTLVKKIVHHLKAASQGGSFNLITLSVSSFVPKPQTPFQWAPMAQVKELKRRARLLKSSLKGRKRIRITFDRPKWAAIEGLLARGDRRVGQLLEAAFETSGDWDRAFKSSNLNPDYYTARERDPDEPLPWEIVDSGIERGFLWDEFQRSLKGQESPACFEGCHRCGVC
ncbi:MAG: radical SAM protein [Deltaproteobacteria bacterium]|nr:radical SAM protein [Deltaproteobacteria bacterium]